MSIMDQMRKLMKDVESMEIQALRAEFHRLYGDIPHPVNTRTLKNRIIYRIQEMYLGFPEENFSSNSKRRNCAGHSLYP